LEDLPTSWRAAWKPAFWSWLGIWAWWQMLVQFIPPVLIGNMIGGAALFALISYAQVMDEI